MVSVTGPDENEALVLDPDAVDAAHAVETAETTEISVGEVIAAIRKDAAALPEQYLTETEVPGGGE